MMYMRKVVLGFCLAFISVSAWTQEVRFVAQADAREIVKDSYLQVTFKLENAEGQNFRPPAFQDFQVVSGPNSGMRTTIINGVVSRQITYGYTLQPKKTGILTIGPAQITAINRNLQTDPIVVKVVAGSAVGKGGLPTGKKAFLRAEISDTVAFVGQQLVLDYKLYTTQEVESYNILREPTYPGFFAQGVRRFDSRLVREVIDGVEYVTKVIRRVVLYPQQSGMLEIEPMNAQLGVAEANNQRRGFFFNRKITRVPALTNELDIQVKPLPEPKPADFEGAIGSYTLRTAVDKVNLSTDDALNLRLVIRGTGDSKRILPPALDLGPEFEVYDPKTVRDETYEMTNDLTTEKEFLYPIMPLRAGQYRIQPTFTYFDVDSAKYVTLSSRVYPIQVTQGQQSPGAAPVPTQDTMQAAGMHGPIAMQLKRPGQHQLLGSPIFWLGSSLPFVLLLGLWWQRRQRLAEAGLDPETKRRRDARKQAMQRLAAADAYRKEGKSSAFYDELSKAMLSYVSDKLHIPASQLTKANVQVRLEELGVGPDNVQRFIQMLHTAEMALYAGKDNATAMEQSYKDAVEVLGDIEASSDRAT